MIARRNLAQAEAEPVTVRRLQAPAAEGAPPEPLDSVPGLAAAWDRLADEALPDSPYLTWEWALAFSRVYLRGRGPGAPRPFLLGAYRGERLVGIAPLYRATERVGALLGARVLRLLGTGPCHLPTDLDLLVRPDDAAAVGRAFGEHLHGLRGEWDLLDLSSVASGSPPGGGAAAALHRALAERGMAASDAPAHQSRHALLPGRLDEYLGQMSPGYGKKLGRYQRRLLRELPYRPVLCQVEERLTADLSELVRMRLGSWQGPVPHVFMDGRFVAFHRQVLPLLLSRGWLRLLFLETPAGQRLAGGYLILRNGRATFYQQARRAGLDRLHVGSVLIYHLLEQAIAEGARSFDFGPDAAYKTHFAWHTREDRNLRVYGRSPAGLLRRGLDRARVVARHLRPPRQDAEKGG